MSTLTSAQRDENRLTDDDRERIRARLAQTIAAAEVAAVQHYRPTWGDVEAFVRIARHAIGCTAQDLRASELAEIHRTVTDHLNLTTRALRLSWHASAAGDACDRCDECGGQPVKGDRVWLNSYPDLMCDPCMDRNREPAPHQARPDDMPDEPTHCKDCGQPVTWYGPTPYDWRHMQD